MGGVGGGGQLLYALLLSRNISIFVDSGKRMKLWNGDRILGRNEKCINLC